MPGSCTLLGPEDFDIPIDTLDYGRLKKRTEPFETRLSDLHAVLENFFRYQEYTKFVFEAQLAHAEKKLAALMSKSSDQRRKSFQTSLDLVKSTVKTFQEKQKKLDESLRILYQHQYDLQQETRNYKRSFVTKAIAQLRYDPNVGTSDPLFTSPTQLAVRSGYTQKPDAKRKRETRNIFSSQSATLVGDAAGILPANLSSFSPAPVPEDHTPVGSPSKGAKKRQKTSPPTTPATRSRRKPAKKG